MAIENDFLELMPLSVTLTPATGRDLFSKITHGGDPVDVRCHITYQNRVYRTADGRDVAERGRVYLFGVPEFDPETTKVTLPNGDEPVVHGATTHTDETGEHHTVIHFG